MKSKQNPPPPPLRMLLIDEKSYLSHLDRQGFRDKGIIVYTADNETHAQQHLNSKSIDVITINMDFNHNQGMHIFKFLYDRSPTQNYLWVATSVHLNSTTETKILSLGAQLVIHLPISKDFLIKKVRAALGGEVRQQQRLNITGTVTICCDTNTIHTTLQEISTTGLLVGNIHEICAKIPPLVKLIIHPIGLSRPLHLMGKLARVSPCEQFLAFKFHDPTPDQRTQIDYLITQSQSRYHQILQQSI